jgi:serine/threonine-protein kinase
MLGGRYELGELIGRGGMADVRTGFDRQLGRQVAVKVMHAHLAAQPEARRRFRLEATSAASLNHPNAVTVFDTGEGEAGPFIVMERLPGRTFADEMAEGPVPAERVREVALAVLGALGAAHELGIVHRDIKPSNLMLTGDGTAKVGDFGIARSIDGSDLTLTGQVVGTPRYAAPERLRGEPCTPSGDLYSLGVVLYEAATGRQAFEGDSPVAVALAVTTSRPAPIGELRPGLDPALRAAVERAMAPEPGDRFVSAASMAEALAPPTGPATAVMPHLGAGRADERTVVVPVSRPSSTGVDERIPAGAPRVSHTRRRVVVASAVAAAVLLTAAWLWTEPGTGGSAPAGTGGPQTTLVAPSTTSTTVAPAPAAVPPGNTKSTSRGQGKGQGQED